MANRQLDRHTDAHIYICTHRQADKAICQPVRNLQASIRPTIQSANHSEPAASTWRHQSQAYHKCRGMCTNSAVLRNQGSGNTMAGFIQGIPAFQWRPLCLSLHCPVMKTTHAGKKLIGLSLRRCVCGVWRCGWNTKIHKPRDKYGFSDREVTPSITCTVIVILPLNLPLLFYCRLLFSVAVYINKLFSCLILLHHSSQR